MRKKNTAPLEWRIHIGAHKTATTHVQETLAACREDLSASGVDFLPTPEVRSALSPLIEGRLMRRRWRFLAGTWPANQMLRNALQPVRRGAPTAVLSEENLMGPCVDALFRTPYPDLEFRLRLLAGLIGGRKATLFLSIRSFDRVLPGAYATALRFPYKSAPEMSAIKSRIHQKPPSWFDIVARIRKSFPDTSLKVWKQEDYRKNSSVFLDAIVGKSNFSWPKLRPPQQTKTPSHAAIEMVENRLKSGGFSNRNQEVDAIYARHPAHASDDRYMPFSAGEIEILQNKYLEDLHALQTHFPEMIIRLP